MLAVCKYIIPYSCWVIKTRSFLPRGIFTLTVITCDFCCCIEFAI